MYTFPVGMLNCTHCYPNMHNIKSGYTCITTLHIFNKTVAVFYVKDVTLYYNIPYPLAQHVNTVTPVSHLSGIVVYVCYVDTTKKQKKLKYIT